MPKINRTLKRSLDILKMVAEAEYPCTITQISEYLKIPLTSAFDLVHTLCLEGYLETSNGNQKAYTLGMKLFELSSNYVQKSSLPEIARPYVRKVMHYTDSTAFLVVAEEEDIVYIDKCEAHSSLHTSASLGSRNNYFISGLGKSILAYMDTDKVRKMWDKSKIVRYTQQTILTFDDLLEDLEATRKRGYAIDDREANRDIFCIAHAIFDHSNQPVAALSTAMMYTNLNTFKIQDYGELISRYTYEISIKLGYASKEVNQVFLYR